MRILPILALLIICCVQPEEDTAVADVNLTESAVWTTSAPVPAPGDPIRAGSTSPGSVRKVEQALLNRSKYVRPALEQATTSTLVDRAIITLTPSLATLSPMGNVALYTDTGQTTTTFDQDATGLTVAPTGLTVGDTYYFYVHDNAGTLEMVVSGTGPDVALCYQQGDVRYKFVGIGFVVQNQYVGGMGGDTSAAWLPSVINRGHWMINSEITNVRMSALSNAAGASWANLDLSSLVPPFVYAVDIYAQQTCAAGNLDSGTATQVRRTGLAYESRTVCQSSPSSTSISGSAVVDVGSGAGSIVVAGAFVGDKVLMATNMSQAANSAVLGNVDLRVGGAAGPAPLFEGTISVAGHIAQLAAPAAPVALNDIVQVQTKRINATYAAGTITALVDSTQKLDWQTTNTSNITVTMDVVGAWY